jgi:hypothetical protein
MIAPRKYRASPKKMLFDVSADEAWDTGKSGLGRRWEALSMASKLFQRDVEGGVFPKSNAPTSWRGNGFSRGANRPEGLPTLAPWSKLSWGLFFPLVFAGNVVVAILAWFIVELVMN